MGIRKSFARFTAASIFAVFVCAVPSFTLAAGPEKKASAPQPRPDTVTKVYTNDDLGWHSATPAPAASRFSPGKVRVRFLFHRPQILRMSLPCRRCRSIQSRIRGGTQSSSAKGKRSLPRLRSREAQLAAFRASGSTDSTGPTIGLVLNAPCEGIKLPTT